MGRPMPKKTTTGGSRPRRARSSDRPAAATAVVADAIAAPAAAPADVAEPVTQAIASAPPAGEALALGASLSIREVGERAAQLEALFAAGRAEVDARMLESVDTAGLQLLLAAAAAARRGGLTLRLLGADRLNAGPAGALGLNEHLAAAAEILP